MVRVQPESMKIRIPTDIQVLQEKEYLIMRGKQGIKKANIGAIQIENSEIFAKDLATRRTIKKLIQSVTVGFKGKVKLIGVGYKANENPTSGIEINLGFKDPIQVAKPKNMEIKIKANGTVIEAKGNSLEKLNQYLSKIEHLRPTKKDIYKGKGAIRMKN